MDLNVPKDILTKNRAYDGEVPINGEGLILDGQRVHIQVGKKANPASPLYIASDIEGICYASFDVSGDLFRIYSCSNGNGALMEPNGLDGQDLIAVDPLLNDEVLAEKMIKSYFEIGAAVQPAVSLGIVQKTDNHLEGIMGQAEFKPMENVELDNPVMVTLSNISSNLGRLVVEKIGTTPGGMATYHLNYR